MTQACLNCSKPPMTASGCCRRPSPAVSRIHSPVHHSWRVRTDVRSRQVRGRDPRRSVRRHDSAAASACDCTARPLRAITEPRRLAATVRNFYVVKAYGAIQEPLTGVKIDLYAPGDWIESHSPAPSRNAPALGCRSQGNRLRWTSHRLSDRGQRTRRIGIWRTNSRRGGKRVVLLENGSFIVPGSMETRLIDDLIDTRTTRDGAIRVRNGLAVRRRVSGECRSVFRAHACPASRRRSKAGGERGASARPISRSLNSRPLMNG